MSRIKHLVQQAQEEDLTEIPVSVSSKRFGSRKLTLSTSGPYTQASYNCIVVNCSSCEEVPILHITEPEYDLEVGIDMGIPLEIVFTQLEGRIEKREHNILSKHELATEEAHVFDCPGCGSENFYIIAKDGGIIALTGSQLHAEVPVPKDRIRYLKRPKNEWPLE